LAVAAETTVVVEIYATLVEVAVAVVVEVVVEVVFAQTRS
jgi:hypothetical protein